MRTLKTPNRTTKHANVKKSRFLKDVAPHSWPPIHELSKCWVFSYSDDWTLIRNVNYEIISCIWIPQYDSDTLTASKGVLMRIPDPDQDLVRRITRQKCTLRCRFRDFGFFVIFPL